MNPLECVQLCKFIAARCPAMRMQDETPEAWYVDLVEFDLADAMQAAQTTTLAKAFIGVGDLVTECQNIQRRRIGRQKLAEREAKIAAENPPALETRERPLAALLAGTPIKSAPRRSWQERRALVPGPSKPPFTDEELRAAQAELDQAAALSRVSRETE